jgi:hypothetical protein
MFQDMVDHDEIEGFVWPRERGSLCSVAVQPFVIDRQRATLNIDTRRTPTKGLESPEEIAPPAADIKNARPPRAMRCRSGQGYCRIHQSRRKVRQELHSGKKLLPPSSVIGRRVGLARGG